MTFESRPPASARPAKIAGYRILSVLGTGGMGVVYRAEHLETNKLVALKTLQVQGEALLASLRREVRALSALDHPGVVRVVDDGSRDPHTPYYAMDLLAGETLRDAYPAVCRVGVVTMHESEYDGQVATLDPMAETLGLSERPSFRIPHDIKVAALPALTTLRSICGALAYLHGRGVVHRDLKPENIIVTRDRGPVVVDFGIAATNPGGSSREGLEAAGKPIGSPAYMSPEQILGDPVDARADLYALGTILYELLTGKLPFSGQGLRPMISQKLYGTAPRASASVPHLDKLLDDLVARLLERRPEDRPGHADDVAAVLAKCGALAPQVRGPEPAAYLYRAQLTGRDDAVGELQDLISAIGHPPLAMAIETAGAEAETVAGSSTLAELPMPSLPPGEGERGSLVLLSGEGGAGKTRIAMELMSLAARRGMMVVSNTCVRVDVEGRVRGGIPLGAFSGVLQAVADRCHARPEDFVRLLGERAPLLARFEPAIRALPKTADYAEPPELAPDAARERLFDNLRVTLRELLRGHSVLLVIDDLQWADAASLALLKNLAAEFVAQHRLIILGTYRAEESSADLEELAAMPQTRHFPLRRLSDASLLQIVSDMLAVRVPDARLVNAVVERSEGNPFFVAEYLRAAIERKLLFRGADSSWVFASDQATELSRLALPGVLRDLLRVRLESLSAEAVALARLAAVLGRELEPDVMTSATHEADLLSGAAVSELLSRQVLEESASGQLRFAHDRLRETVYDMLATDERRDLHRHAGHALLAVAERTGDVERRAAELALHFERGGLPDRGAEFAGQAGALAYNQGAYQDAIEYLEKALTLGESEHTLSRVRWLRRIAESHSALGNLARAETSGRTALRVALGSKTVFDFSSQGPLWERAALAIGSAREFGKQVVNLLRPQQPLGNPDLNREAALVAEALGGVYVFQNSPNRAMLAALFAGNRAAESGSAAEQARAFAQLGVAAGFVPVHALAKTYSERARALASRSDSPETTFIVPLMRGYWQMGCSDGHAANESLREALWMARRQSDRHNAEKALALVALNHAYHGEFSESLNHYEELLQSSLMGKNKQAMLWAKGGSALVWGRMGRAADAVREIDEMLPLLDARLTDQSDGFMISGLAPHCLSLGDTERALEISGRSLKAMRNGRAPGCQASWGYSATCEVAFDLWRGASADEQKRREADFREALAALNGFAKSFTIGLPDALRLRARYHLVRQERRVARRLLQRSITEARKLRMPVEEGLAHRELGRCSTGSEARDHEARAHELLLAVGAFGVLSDADPTRFAAS